jgi:hypothetical protein
MDFGGTCEKLADSADLKCDESTTSGRKSELILIGSHNGRNLYRRYEKYGTLITQGVYDWF